MSAHNHDEEVTNQFSRKKRLVLLEVPVYEKLKQKAEDARDNKIYDALLKCDISGLSKEEAEAKLKNAIDNALDEHYS